MNRGNEDPWVIFEYEIQMYWHTRAAIANRLHPATELELTIKNALVESSMLHTRVLVDILLSKGSMPDDIHLDHLLGGRTSPELDATIESLRTAWGNRTSVNTPCWTLNKMLAHGTSLRSDTFDYGSLANAVDPYVWNAIHQIVDITEKSHLVDYINWQN